MPRGYPADVEPCPQQATAKGAETRKNNEALHKAIKIQVYGRKTGGTYEVANAVCVKTRRRKCVHIHYLHARVYVNTRLVPKGFHFYGIRGFVRAGCFATKQLCFYSLVSRRVVL